jgi:hypothetical protein
LQSIVATGDPKLRRQARALIFPTHSVRSSRRLWVVHGQMPCACSRAQILIALISGWFLRSQSWRPVADGSDQVIYLPATRCTCLFYCGHFLSRVRLRTVFSPSEKRNNPHDRDSLARFLVLRVHFGAPVSVVPPQQTGRPLEQPGQSCHSNVFYKHNRRN